MSLWRHLTHGVRVLTQATRADRELDEEVRHYVEEATNAYIAQGLPAEAARRAARMDIGNALVVREHVRSSAWEWVVMTTASDLRYAVRRLRTAPTFAVVSIVTLALGIGATTAIFSAVKPILLAPLPYRQPSRITTISDYWNDYRPLPVTYGTFVEVAERSRAFDALAVFKPWQPTLLGEGQPERLDGQRVTAGFFQVLGVVPNPGRDFDRRDDVVKGPNVVIMTDGLWRRRFGGDRAAIGRAVTLDGHLFTLVGVLPAQFDNVLGPEAEIFAPLQYDASLPSDGREWGHHLRMIGRLQGGVSIDGARRDLETIARTKIPEFPRMPWAALSQGLRVAALQDDVTQGVRPALLAIFGAVVLLLGIASVNVTNLLLARGAERRREFAMRAALGAGRSRVVRQLMTESLLLAFMGGAAGLLVASAGVRAVIALSPPGLPRVSAIGVDASALLFAAALTTAIGILIGVIPAVQVSRGVSIAGLHEPSARVAGGHRVARRILVVAEVALALVLLVGAGLLLRSLRQLFAVDPGFDPSQVLTMQVQIAGQQYAAASARHRFFDRALDDVRRVPGVETAGWTSQLPLSGDLDKYGAFFELSPADRRADDQSAMRYAVTPGYLEAMRIPLRRGRRLDTRDTLPGAPVAVLISESLARRAFPDADAIGQRMHLGTTDLPWYTVVGVVGNVKQVSLAVNEPDAVYVAEDAWYFADTVMSLVVRAKGDPAVLTAAIKTAIWSIDKDQPIVRVATFDHLVARSAMERRFALVLFEVFAIVALLLAATGIYGVLSGSVNERTREMGVRAALGASPADILRLIVGEGLALTAIGAALGVGAAAIATRAIATLLFALSPLDPTTYASVTTLLALVSLSACSVPAARAARIDPAVTLRVE